MKHGGLAYYGGKSPGRPLTKWIASRLPPWEYKSLYCEPFAGMLGVLLSRRPTRIEIVNDTNDRLINWWTMIRDRPEEFGMALDWTHQHSRTGFEMARADLDHEDPIKRAVAFTVIVNSSVQHSDRNGNTRKSYYAVGQGGVYSWCGEDIVKLRERTKHVQLECMDAVELLKRTRTETGAVLYVDPPYRSADTSNYRFVPDWDALGKALKEQAGKVAVSGYAGDWDCLGWHREDFDCHAMVYDKASGTMTAQDRKECLWTNYDPPAEGLFG